MPMCIHMPGTPSCTALAREDFPARDTPLRITICPTSAIRAPSHEGGYLRQDPLHLRECEGGDVLHSAVPSSRVPPRFIVSSNPSSEVTRDPQLAEVRASEPRARIRTVHRSGQFGSFKMISLFAPAVNSSS